MKYKVLQKSLCRSKCKEYLLIFVQLGQAIVYFKKTIDLKYSLKTEYLLIKSNIM